MAAIVERALQNLPDTSFSDNPKGLLPYSVESRLQAQLTPETKLYFQRIADTTVGSPFGGTPMNLDAPRIYATETFARANGFTANSGGSYQYTIPNPSWLTKIAPIFHIFDSGVGAAFTCRVLIQILYPNGIQGNKVVFDQTLSGNTPNNGVVTLFYTPVSLQELLPLGAILQMVITETGAATAFLEAYYFSLQSYLAVGLIPALDANAFVQGNRRTT